MNNNNGVGILRPDALCVVTSAKDIHWSLELVLSSAINRLLREGMSLLFTSTKNNWDPVDGMGRYHLSQTTLHSIFESCKTCLNQAAGLTA